VVGTVAVGAQCREVLGEFVTDALVHAVMRLETGDAFA